MNYTNFLIITVLFTQTITQTAAPTTRAATRGAFATLTPRQAATRIYPLLLQSQRSISWAPKEGSQLRAEELGTRRRLLPAIRPSTTSSIGWYHGPSGGEPTDSDDVHLASEDSNETCDKINSLSQFCTIATKISGNSAGYLAFCETVNQMKQFCDTLASTKDVQQAGLQQGPIITKKNIGSKAQGAAKEYATNQLKKSQVTKFIANSQKLFSTTIARAIRSSDLKSAALLLDLNLLNNINMPNLMHGSLLSQAVIQNDPDLVKLLLKKGAYAHQVDGRGKWPIEYALTEPTANPLIIDYLTDAMRLTYGLQPKILNYHKNMAHPQILPIFTKALNRPYAIQPQK